MKKLCFLCLAVLAALIVSCKSTPVQQQKEPEIEVKAESESVTIEEAAFHDAYQSVLPLIMDNAERYVVKEGDTLTKIARAKYGRGNAYFFPLIMAASKALKTVDIVDPDLIEPGMELIIPNLDANRNNSEIRGRIKTLLLDITGIYTDRPETRWSLELVDGLSAAAKSL
jgi:LysM repeat protein